MKTFTPLLVAAVLLLPLSACKNKQAGPDQTAAPGDTTADADLEGREIVPNWEAQTGDVTVCPLSGRKFEVKDEYDRYAYQGYNFVFCCADCIDEVEEDPGKYLDSLVEQAGGPAEGEGGDDGEDGEDVTDVESEPGLETESDPGFE